MKLLNILKLLCFTGLMFIGLNGSAQLKIGGNPNIIQPSSILELESNRLGFLLPRMNTIQRDSISNDVTFDPNVSQGLMIYNVEDQCINLYDTNQSKGWTNPCRSKIESYTDTTAAKAAFTPKEGDIIADGGCRCIMIYSDKKWQQIDDSQNEWVLDSIQNMEVYLFNLAAINGDTIVITKDGRFGIGESNPTYFFQTVINDSLLAKFTTMNGGSFLIHSSLAPMDSTVALISEFGPLRLQSGYLDSFNYLELSKEGKLTFASYGLGEHATSKPAYMVGVDSSGQLVEFTGFWAFNSDSTLKENIAVLENATSKLLSISGVSYNWKEDAHPVKKFGPQTEYGVIAQQIELIAPNLVTTDNQGFKMVNYTGLIPLLIEAHKEQDKRFGCIEAKVESMEERLDKLEAENEALRQLIKTLISK